MDESPLDEAIYELERAALVHADGAAYHLNSETRKEYHRWMQQAIAFGLAALRARKGEENG